MPDPSAGRSEYCVQLKVVQGKLAVDSDAFQMNSVFASRLKGMTLAEAQNSLRGQVAKELSALPKPYQAGLAPGETDTGLTDALTEAARNASSAWTGYTMKYANWMGANPNRNDLGSLFATGLFDGLAQPAGVAADLDLTDHPPDAFAGILTFTVLDPFDSTSLGIMLAGMIEARKPQRIKQLRFELKTLDGKLWSAITAPSLQTVLGPFYGNLGLTPAITVFPLTGSVNIDEGPRILSVILAAEVEERDIDSILWNILTHEEFGLAMKARKSWIDSRTLPFEALGHPAGDQPYVLQYKLQAQQLLVSQQGYAFTLQPAGLPPSPTLSQFVNLRVQKASAPAPADAKKPKPDGEGTDEKGLAREDRQTPQTQSAGQGPDASADKDKTRRIGIGITYRPGQAISFTPLFQISRLEFPFENGTLSAEGGGPNGTQWSGNYFADFLGFEKLHQRVSLRLNGSQEVDLRRFLNGRKVDQLQTVGLANVEWEPFRDWKGNVLRLHVEGDRSTVKLATNTATISTQNLTTVEVGGLYFSRSDQSDHPQQSSIAPAVVFGLGASASESTFTHFKLIANHHRALGVWEYDFAGRFEQATTSTPIFDQPSFGGADIVRGFRADDAIGLRLWSLQSELLHPIPGLDLAGVTNQTLHSLLSGLKLAGFYDVGGIYSTTASQAGQRSGTGTGIHIDMGLAVLKFDWAYGFGNAATGGSRGKFYFGITLNIPN
jgi:hypothetical protein